MIGPGGCPGTGHCEDYLGTRGHGGTIYSARWSVVCQVVGAVVAGPGRAHLSPQNLLPSPSAHSTVQRRPLHGHHPAQPRVLAPWSGEGACVTTVIAPVLIVLMVLIEALPMLTLALAGHTGPRPQPSPAPGPGSHRSVCGRVLHRQHLAASTGNTGEQ